MRLFLFILVLMMSFSPGLLWADHREHSRQAEEAGVPVQEEPVPLGKVEVEPNRAVIEVEGVVCSFCAYGIEQKLKKLPFLDRSQFTQGIFTDVERQVVTIALNTEEPVDLKEIDQAISGAGYDLVAVHLRVSGALEQGVIQDSQTGQRFRLSGQKVQQLGNRKKAQIQGHINADQIPSLKEGEPVLLFLDRVGGEG